MVLFVGLIGVVRFGSQMLLEDTSQRPACLPYPRSVTASAVHLTPGLQEHQSWVDFAVRPDFSGYFGFCLDGPLMESGGGEQIFEIGVARFNVSTTWVNLVTLDGELDSYRDAGRWELRTLCAAQIPSPC